MMGSPLSTCCKPNNTKGEITLLMLGLDNAGKTTTVKNFLNEPVEDVVPTVGFSTVEMNFKKHHVTIFDLGGGSNIRGIWKNYYALVHGLIFVVDSSAKERLDEIKFVMDDVLKDPRISGKPVLLLVNKQDIDGALNEVELCTALDVETVINEQQCPTRVETSCAVGTLRRKRKRVRDKGIEDGFQWLLGHISDNFLPMSDRVGREVAKQKELEEQDRKERMLRVQKIREERERLQQQEKIAKGRLSSEPEDDCGESQLNPFRPIGEYHQKERAERKASVGGPRIIHVTPAVSPEVDSEQQESARSEEVDSFKQDTASPPSEHGDRKQGTASEEDGSDTTLILVNEPPLSRPTGDSVPEATKVKKKKKKFSNKVGSTESSAMSSSLPPLKWENANNSSQPQQGGWTNFDSVQSNAATSEGTENDVVQRFTATDSLTSLSLTNT